SGLRNIGLRFGMVLEAPGADRSAHSMDLSRGQYQTQGRVPAQPRRRHTLNRAVTSSHPQRNSTARPAIRVEHLTKRFGERVAFEDVSFDVGQGEVFGFLGPNGAGKTTTVRTLGTLLAPTSGSATVAGVPLAPDNGVEIRSRIAIMPEAPGLYLRLSVRE